jgi:predicted  nucleic acid-binding Zn-ribbon protein
MYCVKCKRKTESTNITIVTSKNGRRMHKSTCFQCGGKKFSFIKSEKSGGDIVSYLANNFSPPEMHLPGHNFTGPFTKLDKRLDPTTDEPYPWSKPINRVDEAALHHDKCYRDNQSTESRNKCDDTMIQELDRIENPTVRERIERGIVKPIIKTKARFGLGINTKNVKKGPMKTK